MSYRYVLERGIPVMVGGGPRLCWLMLNPSTADAVNDDPTIRKVIGFTRRAGFGAAVVVNLFAWRATEPRDLRRELERRGRARAEGPRNRAAVVQAAASAEAVVCAWGATPWARDQAERVLSWLPKRVRLLRLGTTKAGAPLHPLMLSYADHPLVPFAPEPHALLA